MQRGYPAVAPLLRDRSGTEPRYFWTLDGAIDCWAQQGGRAKMYEWLDGKW
jgi:hypothetical protein